ncbi:MAG: peptidyl-prolyl cis-trans isomerase [Micavibrio aeruginosavorus]|uniref:Periplasmic chaperone PpiD n=1 Tax=Micavibrio aeruginosavorus TaxID=349221 RepID=A0A7T5R0M8_9BACT|nr:MAG: peptidyl-prolyl cis-trans isomerase [Micavibrio aeruginosavorus]
MLNAMRSGAHSKIVKFVIFSFLLLAVAGMAMMDVGGFFRGGVQSTTVAAVAGQKIHISEFDRTVRRALGQQAMLEPKMAYQLGLIDQYLNSQISGILLQKDAREHGIVINDEMIAKQVANLVAPYARNGVSTKDAFQRILMTQNLTEGEFVAMLRSEISTNIMRSSLQSVSGIVSDAEVKDLYQQRNEERTIKLVTLPHSTVKGVEKPTDEVLKPFYQSGQEKYAIPETRTFTLGLLTSEIAQKSLDISDEELKQIYDDRIDEYTEKEKRLLQQAIFTAESAARDAIEKIKSGTSLKEAAKDSYIGEESFEEAGLIAEIAESAFALGKDEVSEPIQTSLGWHVIVLKDVIAPKVKEFESVKTSIRKELIEEKTDTLLVETANMLDDTLAGGETLADAAKDFHIELKKIGPVRADGSTPDNKEGLKEYEKVRAGILEAAFSLESGETSSVQELSDGSYAVVLVENVTPKTYKPFDDVKADLAKTWIADQEDVLNRRRATEALQALNAKTSTLEDIARQNGAVIKNITVNNSLAAEEPMTEPLKKLLFSNDKETYQLSPGKDSYILAIVTDVKMPDPAKAKKEDIDALKSTAGKGTQDEVFLVYFNELRKKHGVKIDRKLLDMTYAGSEEAQF